MYNTKNQHIMKKNEFNAIRRIARFSNNNSIWGVCSHDADALNYYGVELNAWGDPCDIKTIPPCIYIHSSMEELSTDILRFEPDAVMTSTDLDLVILFIFITMEDVESKI